MDGNTLNIMVDTEYISSAPNPLILSIGAAAFRLNGDGSEPLPEQMPSCGGHSLGDDGCWACENWEPLPGTFYRVLNIDDCFKAGLTIDRWTLNWWVTKNAGSWPNQKEAVGLTQAMQELSQYYQVARGTGPDIKIWTHRPVYDPSALWSAFIASGIEFPWEAKLRRFGHVFRDTVQFYEMVGYKYEATGNHNALGDVLNQIKGLQAAYRLWKSIS